jgi:large subunit ribosomal protein L25
MPHQLKAESRSGGTKSELRKLRNEGKVPGVLYGKQMNGSRLIAIEEHELLRLLRGGEAGGVIDLSIDGRDGTQPVMMQEVQRDSLSGNILHVDFRQITMNEPVVAKVRLEFTGQPVGVKEQGGILQVQTREIEVKCLPADLPSHLDVDLSLMAVGDTLFARELPLPERVELHSDRDELIATVLHAQKAEDEADAAESGAPVETPAE